MAGKQTTKKLVALVLALVIGGILIGNVLPVGINSVSDDQVTSSITQGVGNTEVIVDEKINATVNSVTVGTPDTATITLQDYETTNTVQHTVDNQSSQVYALDGGDVTLNLNDVDTSPTPSEATYNVSYPSDYGWDDSTKSLWALIPVFLILGALVLLAGITLDMM